MSDTLRPLFVRLPTADAERLDRAAAELRLPKRELVSRLVRTLSSPQESGDGGRRVVIETEPDALTVGRHSFRPVEPPEVLTPAEAAALLQVEPGELLALAEAGELPARRVGEHWRFSRRALLDWLAAA